VLHTTPYAGPRAETIRVWGRDRLRVLARLLPLLEGAEVYLLGNGLPSFWVVSLGEMRLILGLSGWTANDWTGSGALDQLLPPADPSADLLGNLAAAFQERPALTFAQLQQHTGATAPLVAGGLNRLALLGQVIHDLPGGLYRWRQVMPVPLSLELLGPENPETVAARELTLRKQVKIQRESKPSANLRLLVGQVGDRAVELLVDDDGRMVRGKCTCSHHFTGGLRRGPCRHLQALRTAAQGERRPSSWQNWYAQWSS
jgi:hypothetical protein